MPRFVILLHSLPPDSDRRTHWDLMLERGEQLRTWALDEEPRPIAEIVAVALPNHRLAYLEYEGPIAGDRGHVSRWDAGQYTLLNEDSSGLTVELQGRLLQGQAKLSRHADQRWRFFVSSPSGSAATRTGVPS